MKTLITLMAALTLSACSTISSKIDAACSGVVTATQVIANHELTLVQQTKVGHALQVAVPICASEFAQDKDLKKLLFAKGQLEDVANELE